ncbi:type II toxin-antitoxin system RelE/ParE family toxin [Candidatus Woesearchaeota archaeon]|nr:type II toxin-antitoxin system RelE/ParE family toxin [Candidatus Woesearchaeota archaeon]
MMFSIKYSSKAIKFLKKLNKDLVVRIITKIELLKENPVMHDTKSIEGFKEKLYRIRVGDYRILYEINYQNNSVGIIKIDKRSRIY